MPTPSNLYFGYFIFELIIGFFIAVVGFLYGLSATKNYMRRKEWDDSLDSVIIVNIIWFFLLVFIDFIVLYIIGPTFIVSLITDIIRIVVGIVFASVIVSIFYNKKFSDRMWPDKNGHETPAINYFEPGNLYNHPAIINYLKRIGGRPRIIAIEEINKQPDSSVIDYLRRQLKA